ncbi:unnamed protein product [Mytilus edulis]|uniref:Fibronectin type-III domain-containing protein n=1 Tax=Mytilus edulis TaxID=6550 RepID=A0A8S3T6T0_MYTED|nr:unnamed protein product [Mytilus edulis]
MFGSSSFHIILEKMDPSDWHQFQFRKIAVCMYFGLHILKKNKQTLRTESDSNTFVPLDTENDTAENDLIETPYSQDIAVHESTLPEEEAQETPEGFEIVDCTDHSITVEWNIHDLDNYLEYELVYRRQGSVEWKNKVVSKKDVTANDNGRYVYKLQNLSSDSSYELKLCSVDIHQVKSQPSRLQTWKTLKIAPTQVIKQLPEEDRVRYINLMEDSATERRYFTRIMIVGKEGVGKTCLLRRLLNESIEDVNSTDGVDIVVRRCKINIHDGEWTIEKDITDDNVYRMQKALAQIQSKENEKHEKFNTCHAIASYNGSGMDVQDGNQNNTNNNRYTTEESSPKVHKKSSDADDTNNTINNVDTTDESNPNVHKLCTDTDDTNNTMNNVDTTDKSNHNFHKACTDEDNTINTMNNEETTDESNPNVHKVCSDADDTINTMTNVDTTDESNPNVHKVCSDADDTNNTMTNVDTTDESNANVHKVNPNVHKVSTDANDTKITINNVDTTDESNPNVHKVSTDADDTNKTIYNELTTEESNPNVHKVSTDASDTKNKIETSVEINMMVNESEVNVKDNKYENITNTDTDSTNSENEDHLSSLEMPQDLMSQIFASTSTSSIPSNDYALCGLWDFAGQKDFYATHQVFLTSTAIYLVVADMETDIWKEKEGDTKESTSGKQENGHLLTDDGEYVDYWFDSIHCYRTSSLLGQEQLRAPFDPPVIVVFTGTDRYEQVRHYSIAYY